MIWNSFIFVLFLPSIFANIKDGGLEDACNFMNGQFNQRNPPNREAPRGDTCKMEFRAPTKNEKEANEFCNLYAPWRLIEATHGEKTSCHVEATLMCDPGWIQMLGRCYRMAPRERRYTHADAEKQCQQMKRNGKIAYLNHRYLVGMWKNYFRGIRQVWMRASETADQLLQLDEDPAGKLALAFIGLHYSFQVPFNSLIRLKADKQLQVLCEYEPPITIAEINYLGRRYGEIYHKSLEVTNGILTRTSSSAISRQPDVDAESHYNRGENGMQICKNALKPFMVEDVHPLIPDATALGELAAVGVKTISFSRSGHEAPLDRSAMNSYSCQTKYADFFFKLANGNQLTLAKQYPTCTNMHSMAIKYPKVTLSPMSDSRFAPLMCKIGKAKKYKVEVPPGYTRVNRENGRIWAHRVVKIRKNFWDAQEECAKDGSALSGGDTVAELTEMRNIILAAGVDNDQLWVGATRRKECLNLKSFSRDPSHPCARSRVFEWLDNVANKPFTDEMWTINLSGQLQPDYFAQGQRCLTIAVGDNGWNSGYKNQGFFDDIHCHPELLFVCGKYLDVIVDE